MLSNDEGAGFHRSLLLLNLGKGEFLKITEGAGLLGLHDFDFSRALFADFDNNGALDLMMGRNQLLLFTNNGNGAFTDATARTGVMDQFQFLPTLASDFNGDGFLDIVAKGLRSSNPA